MGEGLQEEFYNCADVRIGGPIPQSVRSNLYFAPPDPQIDVVAIEKPTERKKTLAKGKPGQKHGAKVCYVKGVILYNLLIDCVGFNGMSTLIGHFVSSTEKGRRYRGEIVE